MTWNKHSWLLPTFFLQGTLPGLQGQTRLWERESPCSWAAPEPSPASDAPLLLQLMLMQLSSQLLGSKAWMSSFRAFPMGSVCFSSTHPAHHHLKSGDEGECLSLPRFCGKLGTGFSLSFHIIFKRWLTLCIRCLVIKEQARGEGKVALMNDCSSTILFK